jgi:hypothetical protein
LKPRSKKREHNQFFLWHLFILFYDPALVQELRKAKDPEVFKEGIRNSVSAIYGQRRPGWITNWLDSEHKKEVKAAMGNNSKNSKEQRIKQAAKVVEKRFAALKKASAVTCTKAEHEEFGLLADILVGCGWKEEDLPVASLLEVISFLKNWGADAGYVNTIASIQHGRQTVLEQSRQLEEQDTMMRQRFGPNWKDLMKQKSDGDVPSEFAGMEIKTPTSQTCSLVKKANKKANYPVISSATVGDSSKPVFVSDLQLFSTHEGCVLEGTLITDPVVRTSTDTILRDDKGGCLHVAFYNCLPQFHGDSGFPEKIKLADLKLGRGTRVRISNPYYKMSLSGSRMVRIDDPRDVMLLGKDPRVVAAPSPFDCVHSSSFQDTYLINMLKGQGRPSIPASPAVVFNLQMSKTAGNEAVKRKEWDLARYHYMKCLPPAGLAHNHAGFKNNKEDADCLNFTTMACTFLSNRSAQLLKLDRPEEALADAAIVLLLQPDHKKCWNRYAQALEALECGKSLAKRVQKGQDLSVVETTEDSEDKEKQDSTNENFNVDSTTSKNEVVEVIKRVLSTLFRREAEEEVAIGGDSGDHACKEIVDEGEDIEQLWKSLDGDGSGERDETIVNLAKAYGQAAVNNHKEGEHAKAETLVTKALLLLGEVRIALTYGCHWQ